METPQQEKTAMQKLESLSRAIQEIFDPTEPSKFELFWTVLCVETKAKSRRIYGSSQKINKAKMSKLFRTVNNWVYNGMPLTLKNIVDLSKFCEDPKIDQAEQANQSF